MGVECVVVAMSGGVDSAVAAGILAEQGHNVVGVTLRLFCTSEYGVSNLSAKSCCSAQSIQDAQESARIVGVAHYVLDLSDKFHDSVIEPFLAEYRRGRTPNPCVLCNQYVKFGPILDYGKRFGATHVATGHYARVEHGVCPRLFRGADRNKDQAYALWPLSAEILNRTLFPLGNLTKTQVREKAGAMGLPVADKRESQDICFAGSFGEGYAGLFEDGDPALESGPILDLKGETIGVHRGVAHYTIGQRRGLGIAHSEPLYVVDIDPPANVIRAGTKDDLYTGALVADQANFFREPSPGDSFRAGVKIRYRDDIEPATVTVLADGAVRVEFDVPKSAVATGQSVVFYDGDEVLGGAVIRTRGLGD